MRELAGHTRAAIAMLFFLPALVKKAISCIFSCVREVCHQQPGAFLGNDGIRHIEIDWTGKSTEP